MGKEKDRDEDYFCEAWGSGLCERYADGKGLVRGCFAGGAGQRLGCDGFLCVSVGKGSGYGFSES